MHLNLPPGYHAHLDPEFLVLGRTDGSVVARFSSRGLVADEVERAAWDDYGDAGGGLSPSRALTCVVALLHRVVALFLGRLASPHERRSDGGSQLAPLAVGLGASRRIRGAIQQLEGLLVGWRDFAPLEVLERRVVPANQAVVSHRDKSPSVGAVGDALLRFGIMTKRMRGCVLQMAYFGHYSPELRF